MSFNNGLYHMDVEIIGDIADKMKIIKERENLSIGFVTWSKYENLMISWVQHPPDRYVLPGYSESDAKIPWLNVKAGNIKFYFLQQIEFTFHNNNSPFAPSVCTKNVFEESESCLIWWMEATVWRKKSSIFLVSVSSSVDIAFFISSM